MTLQSSGAISLANVQSEFGSSNPIGINEYYRGGSNVPNSSANSSIPTSGTISLSNFYGGVAATADNTFTLVVGANIVSSKFASSSEYGAADTSSILPNIQNGGVTTNNLAVSETIDKFYAGYPYTGGILGTTRAGGAYDLYNSGGIRGVNMLGTIYPVTAPVSSTATNFQINLVGNTFGTVLQSNIGNTLTITLTY